MKIRIRSPQDLGSGLLFLAIGLAGAYFSIAYEMGTVARMGPGYLPMALSIGLILFGLVVGAQGFTVDGPEWGATNWRPVIVLLLSIAAFALFIENGGLLVACFAVVVIASFAGSETRWREVVPLAVGLSIFCVLVFVYGLNQSMPVFGLK